MGCNHSKRNVEKSEERNMGVEMWPYLHGAGGCSQKHGAGILLHKDGNGRSSGHYMSVKE